MSTATNVVKTIPVIEAQAGQWLVYDNPRMNQRIVEVSCARDGQIRIHADYGNGGEPATLFFDSDDNIQVSDSNDTE